MVHAEEVYQGEEQVLQGDQEQEKGDQEEGEADQEQETTSDGPEEPATDMNEDKAESVERLSPEEIKAEERKEDKKKEGTQMHVLGDDENIQTKSLEDLPRDQVCNLATLLICMIIEFK